MNHLSLIEELMDHPKWVYVKGLLVFPSFKPTQKVRITHVGSGKGWCIDITDEVTASYLLKLYVMEGGEITFKDGLYETPYAEGDRLGEVVLISLCELWLYDD
jgi:hypothetical protein